MAAEPDWYNRLTGRQRRLCKAGAFLVGWAGAAILPGQEVPAWSLLTALGAGVVLGLRWAEYVLTRDEVRR